MAVLVEDKPGIGSRLLIVKKADEEELRRGRPFVGPSELFREQYLAGINDADIRFAAYEDVAELEAVAQGFDPQALVIVEAEDVGEWTAGEDWSGAWMVGLPKVLVIDPLKILAAGHPTPTSRKKIRSATLAIKRVIKKARKEGGCRHQGGRIPGWWTGGKKNVPFEVCDECCEVLP